MKGLINTIIQGDCLEVMQGMPNDSIDLTVTSPPYDNLRIYNGFEWDFEEIAKELYRVTKDGGVVVWVVADSTVDGSETGTSFKQALHFKEIGFNLHDTMIWFKEAVRFPDTVRYYDAFEYMFVLTKGRPNSVNLIRDKPNKWAGSYVRGTERNPDGSTTRKAGHNKRVINEFGVRYNMWTIHNPGRRGNPHPATFPEKLAEDHILSWTNPGDVVLDPFVGSGTTAKMALLNDRKYIGIDISEDYCDIARRRIDEALANKNEKGNDKLDEQ